jgi:hypothetical protein
VRGAEHIIDFRPSGESFQSAKLFDLPKDRIPEADPNARNRMRAKTDFVR